MNSVPKAHEAGEEQILYAKVLAVGMYIGLAALFVTFIFYITGIIPAAVPLNELPKYWDGTKGPQKETVRTPDGSTIEKEIGPGVQRYLRAVNNDFLHREHLATGWSWLSFLGKGDFLNFIGIVILATITIVCYLAILPTFIRKKDRAYVIMALLEVAVLVLAACGILVAGH